MHQSARRDARRGREASESVDLGRAGITSIVSVSVRVAPLCRAQSEGALRFHGGVWMPHLRRSPSPPSLPRQLLAAFDVRRSRDGCLKTFRPGGPTEEATAGHLPVACGDH